MRRRQFIAAASGFPLLSAALPNSMRAAAELCPTERPIKTRPALDRPSITCPRVLVNHVGFRPDDGKYIVIDGVKGAKTFGVVSMHQKGFQPIFTGELERAGPDLGNHLIGDFSSFKRPGTYRISVTGSYPFWGGEGGTLAVWSHNFTIGDDVWDRPIKKLVNYYRVQSCGPSRSGYNSPCHINNIRRDDGGEAKPIWRGWHAADDCVRDVPETLHGLFGLLYLALARPEIAAELDLFQEISWGNDYFHAIQSPEGYLYFGVFADNYFDASKDWWDCGSYILITKPASLYLQYNFISIQALIIQLYGKSHPDYATRCLRAAKSCFEYVYTRKSGDFGPEMTSFELASGVLAGIHMFRVTGGEQYRTLARNMANRLVEYQASGGFWTELRGVNLPDPPAYGYDLLLPRTVYQPLVLVGLCAAARWLGSDPDHSRWTSALRKFADSYVKHFVKANAFGILPFRIWPEQGPAGTRNWDNHGYRYFINLGVKLHQPRSSTINWQTGNTAVTAGYGVVMLYLSEVLGTPELRKLAQRQLDWVLGVNPFAASMILGVGRNQSATYPSLDFVPGVPDIDGAVFEGPIGDEMDNPVFIPGLYANVEFWMPHQAWTLWLMAELSTDHPAGP